MNQVRVEGAPAAEATRVCSRCGRERPLSAFVQHAWCRDCLREYRRAWHVQNREVENRRNRERHRAGLRAQGLWRDCEACGDGRARYLVVTPEGRRWICARCERARATA
jgi:uncharacterized protein (DUF983 family)